MTLVPGLPPFISLNRERVWRQGKTHEGPWIRRGKGSSGGRKGKTPGQAVENKPAIKTLKILPHLASRHRISHDEGAAWFPLTGTTQSVGASQTGGSGRGPGSPSCCRPGCGLHPEAGQGPQAFPTCCDLAPEPGGRVPELGLVEGSPCAMYKGPPAWGVSGWGSPLPRLICM